MTRVRAFSVVFRFEIRVYLHITILYYLRQRRRIPIYAGHALVVHIVVVKVYKCSQRTRNRKLLHDAAVLSRSVLSKSCSA